MKKSFVFLLILGFAIGCGWVVWHKVQSAEMKAQSEQEAMAQMAMMKPAVQVAEIKIRKIPSTLTLPGRISAFAQAQVRPQVNGIITGRLFKEGTIVEKGQQLYQIDDASYKAALASAKADLQSARANVKSVKAKANRYESLVKIEAVSKQDYDDIKAQIDQARAAIAIAQAAVDVAQVNLGYTRVYAPISGRIGRSLVTEGTLVTANQAQVLAVITQLDPVYVDMQQSGLDAMILRNHMADGTQIPVSLKIEESGESASMSYPETGSLEFSEVTMDETTGSVTLRAIMPNAKGLLLPGLFVRAQLDLGEKDALLVPQRATTRTAAGELVVWVLDTGNTAQQVIIKTDGSYEEDWVVTDGLSAGQIVVTEGYQKLSPGAEVIPSFPAQKATPVKIAPAPAADSTPAPAADSSSAAPHN